ncbi:MAG: hypothetical protein Ta2A_17630 [Treponemataceae bacterium]|nr:MAG: hypothetical protein Ta2A_17630 [Treponemataceae bacterium]
MKKINLLFDASRLASNYSKDSGRAGIFFVAYNLLEQFTRQGTFNISLYVRRDRAFALTKMKCDPFLSQFVFITLQEKQYILSAIAMYKKQLHETKNILKLAICFFKLTKNYIHIFFYHLLNNTNRRKLENIDAFFSPANAIIDEIKNVKHIKRFIVLHDAIPLIFPDSSADWYNDRFIPSIDTETYCFCVSENTKCDFLQYIPNRFDKMKMIVTPAASSQKFIPNTDKNQLQIILNKYGVTDNRAYILSLCSFNPHKNLIFTIECFMRFIKKHRIHDLYFYLCGGMNNHVFIAKLAECIKNFADYRDKILLLGYIDDADVNVIYSNALFFTFISKYEGFGTPPLEAMMAGTPVITSNNSSLPEVVGDAAITIDCESYEQCIKAFEDLYFNKDLRRKYSMKGQERAKLFSWEKTAKLMTETILAVTKQESKQSY